MSRRPSRNHSPCPGEGAPSRLELDWRLLKKSMSQQSSRNDLMYTPVRSSNGRVSWWNELVPFLRAITSLVIYQ